MQNVTSPTSSSSSSFHALSIDSTPPAPEVKRCPPRYLISALILTTLLVAAVITIAVVYSRASPSNSSPLPPAPSLTVQVGRPTNSTHWQATSPPSPSTPHTFHWLFPQKNLQWLSDEFDALSDPTHPRYQQWHSHDSLMAVIGPSAEDKAAVYTWLSTHGVHSSVIRDHGDALTVDVDVKTVEGLFNTRMTAMRHGTTGQEAVVSREGQATIPSHLSPFLDRLEGVYDYPHPVYHLHTFRARTTPFPFPSTPSPPTHSFHPLQTQETNAQCTSVSSFYALAPPSLLVTAYNFTDRTTYTTHSNTSNMVTSFGGQAFSTPDLTHFRTNIGYSAPFTPITVNAATNTANLAANGVGDEANLDIQALYQIAPTANNSFYASTSSGSLLAAMQAITALPNATRPQVVSISYSFGASDYNYYAGDSGRTDTQFQQMAVLGITVVVSSGDDGTAGPYNRGCSLTPNTLGYGTVTPLASTPFLPGYPAASPYVLTVGETDFLRSATSANAAYGAFSTSIKSPPECNNCPTDQSGVGFLCQSSNLGEQPVSYGAKSVMAAQTSGGGFSTVYTTPAWQTSAVSGYFGNCTTANGCTLPPSSYYYSNTRGFPDVALFGGYFATVLNGKESILAGTSVAAPLMAGLISRLNEVNLVKKGKTLGFINPLLYSISASTPAAFNDLKTGENACPQGNTACATYYRGGGGTTTCSGFTSAPYWDPVTGLGSPNIGRIITYLQTH